MPILVVTLVLAVLAGLFAPPRVALAVTGAGALFTVFTFVWAVADGKGDDPWWLVPIAIGAAILEILICLGLTRRRNHAV
jgi:hypothetical protein